METDIHDFGIGIDGKQSYSNLLAIDSAIIFVTPQTSAICEGGSDTLTATGATTYTWIPATGLSATTGSSVIASPATTTTYIVTGIAGGQISTKIVTVTVTPPPAIMVSAASTTICLGAITKLTASGAATYTWSPSAGLNTTIGGNVLADPTVTTTYSVTGTTADGCSAANTIIITVNPSPAPTITVTPNPPSYCSGASSVLMASGAGGGGSYVWSPLTSLSDSTGANVTANPTATTTYTVTGTNSGGCSSANTVTVTVNPSPTITASPNPASYCSGGSSVLTASGGNTYSWSPSTGLSATTGQVVAANPTVTTTYIVIGTNVGGCSAANRVVVTVHPNPILTTMPVPTSYCSGGSSTITASGANNYTWSPSTGLNATIGASVDASPTITTVYNVTGTNSFGCSTLDTVLVIVNPNPTVTAFASPASYCTGGISTLTASGANTYTWSPSTDLSATTGEIVAANPTVTTNYIVIGTNSSGCQSAFDLTISVGTSATITAAAFPLSYCVNGSTTLTASGGNTYTWSPSTGLSDTTGSMVIASPTVTTTYTIFGSSGTGCNGTTTVTVTVNPNPTITATPAPSSYCPGGNSILTASGGSTYSWSPSMGLSDTTGSAVTASPSMTTTYIVTGTTSGGCSATDTLTVTVDPAPDKPTITQSGNVLTSSSTQGNQWVRNDSTLNGATNQTYKVTVAGWYKVIAVNPANGCSATSDSVYITPTGIEQLTMNSGQLTVYPNPTGGEIIVTSAKNIDAFKVTNLLGQIILKSTLGDLFANGTNPSHSGGVTQFTFELKDEGMYFVTVTCENETITKKVLVTR